MLTEIRLNDISEFGQKELVFRFGDRYQAVAFNPAEKKEDVIHRLHDLAENIAHDILIE